MKKLTITLLVMSHWLVLLTGCAVFTTKPTREEVITKAVEVIQRAQASLNEVDASTQQVAELTTRESVDEKLIKKVNDAAKLTHKLSSSLNTLASTIAAMPIEEQVSPAAPVSEVKE